MSLTKPLDKPAERMQRSFEAEPARLDRRKLLQGLLASAVFPVSKSIDLIDPTLLGYKGFQYDEMICNAPFIPLQIEKIQIKIWKSLQYEPYT